LCDDNEDGEFNNFPLEETKEIDEVDPVNQITLKSNYTNANIISVSSRKLKKRIVNSVLNHSKRAKQIIEEWQNEREKENAKDEEETDKESHSRIPFSIIKDRKSNNFEDTEEKTEHEDCPLLIPGDDNSTNNSNNLMTKNDSNEKNLKRMFTQKKNKSTVFKKKLNEKDGNENNFVEIIGDIENLVDEETSKINEREDSNVLQSKRKIVQKINKNSTKKSKPVEKPVHKINKKVSFNMRDRNINNYDMQKPITLTSNKVINSLNSIPIKGVLKVTKKNSNHKSVQFM